MVDPKSSYKQYTKLDILAFLIYVNEEPVRVLAYGENNFIFIKQL